jgi:anaerobic magnesium-protoporphyrin IX monomethyl ester cyclase
MNESVTLCSATLGEDGKREPPLGPLYIAAALERLGARVDFRDYQLAPEADCFSGERLADFLANHAEIVAVSCFVDMLPVVIDATRMLREENPDTTIILGGPGPSASADRILELYPWVDGVVRGEGEETIAEWMLRRRAGCDDQTPIAGMSIRRGDRIVSGSSRTRQVDLESLAAPAYHLAEWDAYGYARVITTRGCAYRCSFCDVTALWGNRSVYREIDAVIDEMEFLRDVHGKTVITIVDDTFVQDRKRVKAFCRRLLERRSRLAWSCFSRINLMSRGLAETMALAGCRSVFYGIDSGSPAVLARTHKMVRAEDVEPVIAYSAEIFESVEASFIWGYPFEELEDFKMTLDLAGRVSRWAPKVNVQLHRLSPLPNSPIYKEYPSPLLEPDPRDKPWLLLPAVLLEPQAAAIGRLVRAAPDVYPGFFTLPTPEEGEKRRLMGMVKRTLDRTIGATLFDPETARLMDEEAPESSRALFEAETDSIGQIGVGLALSFFGRIRRRRGSGCATLAGARGPSLVRERNR